MLSSLNLNTILPIKIQHSRKSLFKVNNKENKTFECLIMKTGEHEPFDKKENVHQRRFGQS